MLKTNYAPITELRSAVAYRLPMRKGKLQLGLGIGAAVMQARWTELALQDRTDIQFAADTRGRVSPTLSAGGYYYNKIWFVGLSVPAFITERFDGEDERWRSTHAPSQYQPMLTGGCLIALDRQVKLKPSALLRYTPASGLQADINLSVILHNRIWAGASYRTADAVVAMVQVLPSNQWRIGYAYDLGVSALASIHHGSHELMLQYTFGYRVRVYDPRFF